MAISPIGNQIFVNQNAALPSTQASNELAKEGFANLSNLNEFQSKEKVVDRLDKVAATDAVQEEVKEKRDEEQGGQKRQQERKQSKDESEQETSAQEASEQVDQNGESFKKSHHIPHLDISI